MVNDTISDFLSRIKNGYMARNTNVRAPFAKTLEAIAKVLLKEGYILGVKYQVSSVKSGKEKKELVLTLKYEGKKPAIEQIVRVSKPGARIYATVATIPYVLSGYGIAIVSTSKGLLTNKEARKQKLGGEVICKIW